jgi:glycosyltransferase involved in cell wall biosynthesis
VTRDEPSELPGEARDTRVNDPTVSGTARTTSRRETFNRWLFIPDQYVGWVGPAVREGRQLLQRERFDVIFSSCPRSSAHLTAAALARLSGLPWVADYRDPWTTNQFRRYPTVLHRAAHAGLEKIAVTQAAAVTAVNEPILADLLARFPELTRRPARVIPNGYDGDEPADEVRLGPGFWLVHTGRLYGRDEQLHLFLKAFAMLPDDVYVLFLGVEGTVIRARAQALNISERVHVESFAAHRRALGYQRAADALVLLTGRRPESLSSKVFEYLATGKPIFAVTPVGSEARKLLDEAGASRCATPDEPLAGPLAKFVADARAGRLGRRDESVVARYDVAMLTAKLAELLDELTA